MRHRTLAHFLDRIRSAVPHVLLTEAPEERFNAFVAAYGLMRTVLAHSRILDHSEDQKADARVDEILNTPDEQILAEAEKEYGSASKAAQHVNDLISKAKQKLQPDYWADAPRADGRMEWCCPHGVGHGNHVHGCDGCCQRSDYPGLSILRRGNPRRRHLQDEYCSYNPHSKEDSP